MADAYRLLLALHVVVAFAALLAFWVAVVARKGATAHRSFGGIFVYSMTATAVTAAGLCVLLLADPLAARPPGPEIARADYAEYGVLLRGIGSRLLDVSLATGALLHFGWTALRRRGAHARRARRGALVIAGSACVAGALLLLLRMDGGLLTLVGGLELRALLRRERKPWSWLAEHLAGMIGAGAFANAALGVNIARHYTEDVGLMFAPGGIILLLFAGAIALLLRQVRRSYGRVPIRRAPVRRASGLTARPGRA